MRDQTSDPNRAHQYAGGGHHKHHVLLHEHHWITRHPRTVAFILAALFVWLVGVVLSIVHLYISTGIWPLFG